MKKNISELIECLAFCICAVIALWLFCAATPNQLSGEADWTEEAIANGGYDDDSVKVAPPAKKSLQELVAGNELALVGAGMKEEGEIVSLTLVFKRN